MAVLLRASSKVFHRRSRTQRMLPVFTPTLVNGTVLLSLRRWNNNSMEDFLVRANHSSGDLASVHQRPAPAQISSAHSRCCTFRAYSLRDSSASPGYLLSGSELRASSTTCKRKCYFLLNFLKVSQKASRVKEIRIGAISRRRMNKPVLGQANKLLSSEISQVRLSPASLERLSCHSILVLSSLLAIESPSNNTISHPVAVRIASHIVLEKSVSASSSAMDNGKNWTVFEGDEEDSATLPEIGLDDLQPTISCIKQGRVRYIPTEHQVADVFTKSLSRFAFLFCVASFTLEPHGFANLANYFFCQAIHQVLCSFFEAAYEKKGEFFEQFLADNLDGYIIEKLIDSIVYPILELELKTSIVFPALNRLKEGGELRKLSSKARYSTQSSRFHFTRMKTLFLQTSKITIGIECIRTFLFSFFGMLLREQGVPRTSGAKTKQWEFFVGGKSFDCTRSYSQILIGSRLFLTAMAIHLSLRVAPLDLQQGGNSRIPYVHVPAARMSILKWCFFTLFTLVTGGFRGRPMWGTFWVWDARLTSVFISFFIYLGALRFQKLSVEPASISICAGPIDIPIIKSSVNWWNTSHQPGSISRSGTSIHVPMPIPILSNFANSPLSTRIFFVLETRLPIPSFLESPLTEEIEARESIPKPKIETIVRVGHPSSPSRPRFTFQLRSVGLKPPLDSETKDEITIASACMSRMFSAPGGDGDLLRPSPVHQLEPHSSAVDVTISRALQAICRLSACSADLRGFQSPGAACKTTPEDQQPSCFPSSRFLRFKIPLSVQSSHEPESFAEAFNHSCWRNAMQEDAQEKKNKTSVSLPAGKQAIGCKLLFSGMQAQESDLRYGLRQLKKAPRADEGRADFSMFVRRRHGRCLILYMLTTTFSPEMTRFFLSIWMKSYLCILHLHTQKGALYGIQGFFMPLSHQKSVLVPPYSIGLGKKCILYPTFTLPKIEKGSAEKTSGLSDFPNGLRARSLHGRRLGVKAVRVDVVVKAQSWSDLRSTRPFDRTEKGRTRLYSRRSGKINARAKIHWYNIRDPSFVCGGPGYSETRLMQCNKAVILNNLRRSTDIDVRFTCARVGERPGCSLPLFEPGRP
uniref:Cytochrome c assembly protein domain-containing protein n=1 Tax=Salix viminalis TaxID=40686 RepID=A0A6N2MZ32_SALVM